MFKKDWSVIGVYRNVENELHAIELVFKNTTRKQAIDGMYNYLCWHERGLRIGFSNVEHVIARKGATVKGSKYRLKITMR